MMEQLEGLLEGERLITDLNFVSAASAEKGLGLNLRKVLDDPPAGFSNTLNWIDEKYYEAAKDKKTFEVITVIGLIPLFQGPLGFAYAARLN